MRRSRTIPAALVGAAFLSRLFAGTTSMPSPVKEILGTAYVQATTVEQIPRLALTALLNLMKHDPRMANPGDPFNATDVVDTAVPMHRLVLAAGSSESWLIYYEHGGRGYQRHLVVFTLSGDSAECCCVGNVGKQVESIGALHKAGKKGLITCDPCPKEPYL